MCETATNQSCRNITNGAWIPLRLACVPSPLRNRQLTSLPLRRATATRRMVKMLDGDGVVEAEIRQTFQQWATIRGSDSVTRDELRDILLGLDVSTGGVIDAVIKCIDEASWRGGASCHAETEGIHWSRVIDWLFSAPTPATAHDASSSSAAHGSDVAVSCTVAASDVGNAMGVVTASGVVSSVATGEHACFGASIMAPSDAISRSAGCDVAASAVTLDAVAPAATVVVAEEKDGETLKNFVVRVEEELYSPCSNFSLAGCLFCNECLACFLAVGDLIRLCGASPELGQQLTLPDVTQSAPMLRNRRLLCPVAEFKNETYKALIDHISLQHVRFLRIWKYRSLEALADEIARGGADCVLRSVEKIALKGCPLGDLEIERFIAPVFSTARGLKHLNLEKNQVTDKALCMLVESGAFAAARLESMNLRFNRIGDDGVAALASCPSFAGLKWINLKMNSVGDEGALALATMLQSNSSMTLLNLRRQSPGLTDSAATCFAEMLKINSTLEQLRLRRNRITDLGAQSLASSVREHVRLLQHGCSRGSGARFELDLEENRIKEDGVASLARSLEDVPRQAHVELLLHGNPATRGVTTVLDGRVSFESKAEGLLW